MFFLKTVSELAGDLAARATSLRKQSRLTQVELAEKAGVTTITLRRFEKDGSGSIETLIRIARALGEDDKLQALFRDIESEQGLRREDLLPDERLRKRRP